MTELTPSPDPPAGWSVEVNDTDTAYLIRKDDPTIAPHIVITPGSARKAASAVIAELHARTPSRNQVTRRTALRENVTGSYIAATSVMALAPVAAPAVRDYIYYGEFTGPYVVIAAVALILVNLVAINISIAFEYPYTDKKIRNAAIAAGSDKHLTLRFDDDNADNQALFTHLDAGDRDTLLRTHEDPDPRQQRLYRRTLLPYYRPGLSNEQYDVLVETTTALKEITAPDAPRRREQLLAQWSEVRHRHLSLNETFLDTQSNWETILTMPAITDVSNPHTAAMVTAYHRAREIDHRPPSWFDDDRALTGEIRDEVYPARVTELDTAITAAIHHARMAGLEHIPADERKQIETITRLLDRAQHPGTDKHDRQLSYERAMKLLSQLRHVHVPDTALQALAATHRPELTS